MDSPCRVYASVVPTSGRELMVPEAEPVLPVKGAQRAASNPLREVQVTGTAEVSCPADRVSVRVSVCSSKESVSEVTGSVSRRLDYILQTLRQQSISDDDITVRRFLNKEVELYRMDAEVTVTFSDFEKMERVCALLLEKLDKSVCLGAPQFFHSSGCLSQTRVRACLSAVDNAQQKASKVTQLLGQSLGSPLLVKEEQTKEWRSAEEEGGQEEGGVRLPHVPVITASSQVSVSFSLRDRSRKKL
ncbi:interleukin-1 receptor-associated kinase 1-binding protein 1 homolog [Gouania willdenowi]|uniref:Interleukin-1 receptor-associated kinase 1-binding protein 1 n=1 Tax=Gouania willdenowi TaxID=441366 RepID=A0A8C5I2M7_GOUWI|nr:interleukin-1 receptor-associated kinase 1-binding protein 1 [Gouania willdenowi]